MEKKKSIFSYYKPYKKIFFADMFFAIMASIITLAVSYTHLDVYKRQS